MEIHASLILMKAMLIIIIVSMGFRFVFSHFSINRSS